MNPFKSVTVNVWAGGEIVWTPNVRYIGGLRREFDGVELYEICSFDFCTWYTAITGEQVLYPEVYYLLPNEEPNTRTRKVNNDDDIRQMQKDMMNESSLNIWIEKSYKSPLQNEDQQVHYASVFDNHIIVV